jgi:hypothetical protein
MQTEGEHTFFYAFRDILRGGEGRKSFVFPIRVGGCHFYFIAVIWAVF